jgi:hypothetical protein
LCLLAYKLKRISRFLKRIDECDWDLFNSKSYFNCHTTSLLEARTKSRIRVLHNAKSKKEGLIWNLCAGRKTKNKIGNLDFL